MTKLTAQELAALKAFRENKTAFEEFTKAKVKETETRFLSHYDDARLDLENGDMLKAIAYIAAVFEIDAPDMGYEAFETNTGERVEEAHDNAAHFNQRSFMRNMCRQAHWMLGFEEKNQNRLAYRAQQAARANDGTELAMLSDDKARKDWGRSAKINVPLLEDFKAATEIAYEALFGEPYVMEPSGKNKVSVSDLEQGFSQAQGYKRKL